MVFVMVFLVVFFMGPFFWGWFFFRMERLSWLLQLCGL
jgi:hypothetical protein